MLFACIFFICPANGIYNSRNSSSQSCTIFTASFGSEVLFGNNEDYSDPNTYYWVDSLGDGNYGGVYFGFDNFWPQGGVNEMGLAFDVNALPEAPLNPHPELRALNDYEGYIVLRNCATVEEAIELVQEYNWGEAMWGQFHFADATGDAVVISAGRDKELTFTRKKEGDGILVSTNFNLAFYPEDEREGLCWRYDEAVAMLGKIHGEEDLTVKYSREILDAAHVEGASVNTLYSNTFDLKTGDIYLYYFHQFDEVAKLNVAEEVARDSEPTLIKNLFSEETVANATYEYEKHKNQEVVKFALLVTGPIPIIIFVLFTFRKKRILARNTKALS